MTFYRFATYILVLGAFGLLISLGACKQTDDTPPVLILKGDTLVDHVLNTPYDDAGATATDETDGNITNQIFVENNVNVDRLGFYKVTYKVVDEAGNEAVPVSRTVRVINLAYPWNSDFTALEEKTPGGTESCSYTTSVLADSTLNYRIVFYGFACDTSVTAFADISDTLLVLPYQEYQDSLTFISMTGSGWINDSVMYLEYQRKTNGVTSYWNATFEK